MSPPCGRSSPAPARCSPVSRPAPRCWPPRAGASPGAPRRCSARSSASACSACRAEPDGVSESGIVPAPLDELPIHQVPLSVAHMLSSDRNAYDRCYLNAHDRTGDVFLITGLGVYPNLGVIDAYATVRAGDDQVTV